MDDPCKRRFVSGMVREHSEQSEVRWWYFGHIKYQLLQFVTLLESPVVACYRLLYDRTNQDIKFGHELKNQV